MVAPYLCDARNPWHVPDWKWHRAVQFVDAQGLPPTLTRDGDPGVAEIRRLVRFYLGFRQIAHLESSQARQMESLLVETYPDIYVSHLLYSAPERQSARFAVEARILAGQSDSEIAATNGCDPKAIAVFAAIFFDVRAKLHQKEFILQTVFGDALYHDLDEGDYGLRWKLLGYFGGPDVVDSMTCPVLIRTQAQGAGGVSAFYRKVVASSIEQKAAVAAMTQTDLPFLKSFSKFLEVEKAPAPKTVESAPYIESMRSMMSIMGKTFTVGSHLGALKNSPIGEARERGAVELRGDQMMRIACGFPVDGLEELDNLKFPEPGSTP